MPAQKAQCVQLRYGRSDQRSIDGRSARLRAAVELIRPADRRKPRGDQRDREREDRAHDEHVGVLTDRRVERSSRRYQGHQRRDPERAAEGSTLGAGASTESAAHLRSEHGGEQVFGINTESTPLVVGAVAVSLLLVLGLWLAPGLSTFVLLAILVLGLVSAIFDVREAVHQSDEGRDSLVVVASVVAVLHATAAGMAAFMLRGSTRRRDAS